ncbi:hypothetical protein SLEP1_g49705 [Rubroshorea leprosula]|uniref:Uncharacterized protein n=1 Tax=Rubroshorea leprosula TaxID=152421 RepID=A0AAV5LYL9_9ROSI|nr:hypothetical protein SLEP1_g49705 [Rubroshorea leprosula]
MLCEKRSTEDLILNVGSGDTLVSVAALACAVGGAAPAPAHSAAQGGFLSIQLIVILYVPIRKCLTL